VFIASVIVQSNCHILQFLHQMFDVSALLLEYALLKCAVTEVCCLEDADISQGSVATHLM